jgi:hypothetical protein
MPELGDLSLKQVASREFQTRSSLGSTSSKNVQVTMENYLSPEIQKRLKYDSDVRAQV